MKNKMPIMMVTCAIAAVLIAAFFALREKEALRELRVQLVNHELPPIGVLLKENQALLVELRSEPFTEKDSGILESYLAKIRRDGVPKHEAAARYARREQHGDRNADQGICAAGEDGGILGGRG